MNRIAVNGRNFLYGSLPFYLLITVSPVNVLGRFKQKNWYKILIFFHFSLLQ